MSEPTAEEPTMEEILASIRRIISEDDSAPTAVSPPPVEAHETDEPDVHDDVLELTDRVEPPPPVHNLPPPPVAAAPPPPPNPAPPPAAAPSVFDTLDDLDVSTPTPALAPPPKPAPPRVDSEALVTPQAAERAAGHFGALTQSLAMPAAGRSLEDVVRELLRPLLKEWLETHLSTIVEARVQAEVERISRGRGF